MLIAIDNGNRLVKGIHFEPFISDRERGAAFR